ncbi:hypothetical protein LSP03_43390 [Lysinibacillus sphaericus]|uniref:Uncharacterized protein n=1 Tax=Lysinibacillus sphaericus TaxID=1421 RepID=A0A2S0K1D9_LYSSH|nr:hypothetical protein LS41612_13195 [Lysinibacillus sphaericus]GEC84596.1 hypothetical protein LSP03_43390 [Lysinibacillus sphaericus]
MLLNGYLRIKNITANIVAKRIEATKLSTLKSFKSLINLMKKTIKNKPDAITMLSFFEQFLIDNTSRLIEK